MAKIFLIVLLFLFSSYTYSKIKISKIKIPSISSPRFTLECEKLKELKFKLNIVASNYFNAYTTHTASGGAYRKKIVSRCNHGKCSVIELNRFIREYNPNHPDADIDGMVTLPDINRVIERKKMNKLVKKLRIMAFKKICKSSLFIHKKDHSTFLIKYNGDPMSDLFRFKDGKISSWTVRSPYGNNTIAFN